MSKEATDLWRRALKTLKSAELLIESDPDSAASRAYYAAFHSVSALFIVDGKSFTKHSAVLSAVHQFLVNTNRWPLQLGADFSSLQTLRQIGDYGGHAHVSVKDAEQAVDAASRIIKAVSAEKPEFFPLK